MNEARTKAYAKVNLTLDILGKTDAYHMIDSLVTTVDLFDVVRVKKRRDDDVTMRMRGLSTELMPPEENNAYRAAKLYMDRFGTPGVDIFIDKNIPLGAGLGGSSADAAAVLSLLALLYEDGNREELKEMADACGSDTGYLLEGGYAEMTGRGDEVSFFDTDLRLDILLCVPRSEISTRECYAASDKVNVRVRHTTKNAVEALKHGNVEALGQSLSNGLFPAAASMSEDIIRAYEELLKFSPLGVNMTGSGSCVYALCENDSFCSYMKSRVRGPFRLIQTRTCRVKREYISAEENNV
ncbi:MAG: 4-(cytidine 5'-diphospho)-2-C-methyl-D-erythritol kinase [Clostridia bacterium]|nr:4-(cytidine 5'-diphospho)-2-C-methyl-D-erythritol kinase [Clostridia bacterium]